MTSLQALAKLNQLDMRVFRTADAASLLQMNIDAASKVLTRLGQAGLIKKILRGLWCLPKTDALLFPEAITAPEPSYISLQTALYIHGMISQIPQVVYAVSLSRTKVYKTPLATVSIHHIQPDFFFGYELYGPNQIKIATPEKALLDIFYLTATKTRLFVAVPEIELDSSFNKKLVKDIVAKIADVKRRSLVQQRWQACFENQ